MTATSQARPTSLTWRALGTYVYLATADPAQLGPAQAMAQAVLAEVDRTCSRFRSDSDLMRANARPGRWVAVDPLLVAAVSVAVEAAEHTDGLVDPCLGRSMVQLGYDADLDEVRRRPAPTAPDPTSPDPTSPGPPPAPRRGAWRDIGLDPDGAVRVPHGCSLDLGATAKAWAADLVAATLVDGLGCGVVVSLGGDIRCDAPPDSSGPGWPVRVTERPGEGRGQTVWLAGGGLATSSTTVRRWSSGGPVRHHIVDPRTGLPTTGPWRTVTATGPTSVAANTASTAALVLGDQARPWLRDRSVTARLVSDTGAVHAVGSWPCALPSAGAPGLPFSPEEELS